MTLLQDASSGVMNFMRGGPTVKYDPRKFRMIGGVSRPGTLLMIRNDARARFANRSAKPVVVGDTDGIRTWIAMTVWGAEYLGWNLRWIYGYPGSRELQLAIRQGEIDMWSTQNAKLVKDLQSEGVVQSFSRKKIAGVKISGGSHIYRTSRCEKTNRPCLAGL